MHFVSGMHFDTFSSLLNLLPTFKLWLHTKIPGGERGFCVLWLFFTPLPCCTALECAKFTKLKKAQGNVQKDYLPFFKKKYIPLEKAKTVYFSSAVWLCPFSI